MMGEVCFSALNAVYTIAHFHFVAWRMHARSRCTQYKERYCSQKLNNVKRDGTHAPNADLNVFDPFSVNALESHLLTAFILLPARNGGRWIERASELNSYWFFILFFLVASAWCDVCFPKIAHTERKTWIIHVKTRKKKPAGKTNTGNQQHRNDYILSNTC